MNYNPQKLQISCLELDRQSPVKINNWLDINSEECQVKDPDYALTKKWCKMLMEDGSLKVDSQGRIWGYSSADKIYYPFHFNIGTKLYGFRLAMTAAN